jgi:preprotein translocase subunit SecD
MGKLSKFFSNTRIWIYIIFFILTMFAINPNPFHKGVAVRTVLLNSSAYLAGMQSPNPSDAPMNRERIIEINGLPVSNMLDYEKIIAEIPDNSSVFIKTEKSKMGIIPEEKTYPVAKFYKNTLGLKVYDAPKNNILLGLDLQGGTRVVLQPETKLSPEDMDILIRNMQERLNLFGLSDTAIRVANDLAGNQFIVVEIAGANEEEVKELLAKQGKFEAKIGNETVFLGGKDITYVCRTADCSGIDPQYGCQESTDGYGCRFRFSITLSKEAAERQAGVTKNLDVVYEGISQGYLAQNIDLYLDDVLVDSLRIGSELKGNPVTDISISGSGIGRGRQEAILETQKSMKKLQTVLITGSLPVKLTIIKTDALSPSLGEEFLRNAFWIAILSEIAVTLIIILRYRKIKIAIPIITVITSEILLILGISALFKQNIDIAGIAGIVVAIGTGVDDQIIITDELLHHGKKEEDEESYLTWSQRVKKAFFIVMAAFFATTASMVPLLFAGAGLLKGFAVTTIIGVSIGVLITRPAFAEMMEILLEED